MNCKMIEDLLPIYIEGECNDETKNIIKEHLATCDKCNELYKKMSSDISKDIPDTKPDINEIDLINNIKKDLKYQFSKNILKNAFLITIILNIITILALYFLIKKGYDLEYVHPFYDSLGIKTYIILFIFTISPLLLSILGLYRNYKKNTKFKIILSVISLIITVLLSISCNIILFAIPPFESYTDFKDNYLNVGTDLKKYENIYKDFFPKEIPNNASDIKYTYRKYNSLFETKAEINASWVLPEDSYYEFKNLIENNYSLKLLDDNKYEVTSDSINKVLFLKLYFQYNDDSHELHYTGIIQK